MSPLPTPRFALRWVGVAAIAATGVVSCAQTKSSPPNNAPDYATTESDLALLSQELDSGASSAASADDGPAGIVPFTRGFNASLILSSEHSSENGWAEVTEPDLAFRFNRHFATNLSIPVYGTINISVAPPTTKTSAKNPPPPGQDVLQRRRFLLGDLSLGGSYETTWKFASYTFTATLGMPTGDDRDGLGAGQFTYSFINHFEKPVTEWLTPDIELGVGDSSDLLDMRVLKNYNTTGENAHFQAGLGFDLPWSMTFNADAFENLPLAKQTVTSTTTNGKKGKQLKTITTTSEKSIGEDNGFLSALDIPLGRHVTLSGFYSRSLRNKTDTAGASLTFLLRGLPRAAER